jgi:hypothetical protein
MRKLIFVLGFCCILLVSILSGCQENKTTGVKTFEGVSLVSNVVNLANASFTLTKDENNIVTRAEVRYLFHNRLNKPIKVQVTASFYDAENNLITTGGPKFINLLENYTERTIGGANIISYDGENVGIIDHVIITAIQSL